MRKHYVLVGAASMREHYITVGAASSRDEVAYSREVSPRMASGQVGKGVTPGRDRGMSVAGVRGRGLGISFFR